MTFRQTGHTTQQMRAAPRNAIYVWPTQRSIRYAETLARHLGRNDLTFVTPSFVDPEYLQGLVWWPIVVDHAAFRLLTAEQHRMLDIHACRKPIDQNVN